jgi:hypothetical protein
MEHIGEAAVRYVVAIVWELTRVVVEGDAVDIIERELLKRVLKVEKGAGCRGTVQQREEAAV